MQEFNLASSEKQDEILSHFPIDFSAVKNVQRGVFEFQYDKGSIDITISTVDPSKCHVELYGVGRSKSDTSHNWGISVKELAPNTLTVANTVGKSDGPMGSFSYEIIQY